MKLVAFSVTLLFVLFVSSSIVLGAKSDETIKLLAVGSWGTPVPNVTAGAPMMFQWVMDYFNRRNDILPDATLVMYPIISGDLYSDR